MRTTRLFVALVSLAALAGPALADEIPVTLHLSTAGAEGKREWFFDRLEGTVRPDGSFSATLNIGGRTWSATVHLVGVLRRSPSPGVRPLGPTGGGPTVIATVAAAGTAVNLSGSPLALNVTACVDNTPPLDPIVATNVLYGGSIAGGFIDGNGDGASTVNSNGAAPYYRLYVENALCNAEGTETNVAPLYSSPTTFSLAPAALFGGEEIPEASFGTPVPSASGPDINGSMRLDVAFEAGPGSIVGMTAVGHAQGQLPEPMQASSGSETTPTVKRPRAGLSQRDAPRPYAPMFQTATHFLMVATRIGFGAGTFTEVETAGQDLENLGAPIPGPSLNGGTIVGSVTDVGGIAVPCAMTSPGGTGPFYTAIIDGGEQSFTLYNAPQSIGPSSAFRSIPLTAASFGAPIPSQIGPQADSTLDLDLSFTLGATCFTQLVALYVVPKQGVTPTSTPTPTATPTNTPTNTPTSTPTPTPTNTPTNTPTGAPTNTPTNTPTSTPTGIPTNTPTNTLTPTPFAAPVNVPTLSGWALLMLGLALGAIGYFVARTSSSA